MKLLSQAIRCSLLTLLALPSLSCADAETQARGAGGAGGEGGAASVSSGGATSGAPGGAGGAEEASGGGGGGGGGAAQAGGAPGTGGAPACDAAACQAGLESLSSMPPGSTTLDFDGCSGGCACCSGGAYADPISGDCVGCSIDAELAAHSITRSGGLGTYFVDCITGNPDAPLGHAALFAAGSSLELTFSEGVSFIGFSALPSSSDSLPTVTLEGYTAEGQLTGVDAFTFVTPGGDCATSNPAARFFGFRGCCGPIHRAVVTFSDPNTAIDTLSYF